MHQRLPRRLREYHANPAPTAVVVTRDIDAGETICRALDRESYIVSWRRASVVALERNRKVMPTVLIVDSADADIERFLSELRIVPNAPATIVLAGSANAAGLARRFHVGVLRKPIWAEELSAVVTVAILENIRPR